MKTILKIWASIAIPMILLVYFGFIFIGGGFNPFEWTENTRLSFGIWVIIFGVLSALIGGATLIKPE